MHCETAPTILDSRLSTLVMHTSPRTIGGTGGADQRRKGGEGSSLAVRGVIFPMPFLTPQNVTPVV